MAHPDDERIKNALDAVIAAKRANPDLDLNAAYQGVLERIENAEVLPSGHAEFNGEDIGPTYSDHYGEWFMPSSGPNENQLFPIGENESPSWYESLMQDPHSFTDTGELHTDAGNLGRTETNPMGNWFTPTRGPNAGQPFPVIDDPEVAWYESLAGIPPRPLPPQMQQLNIPDNMQVTDAEMSKILHAGLGPKQEQPVPDAPTGDPLGPNPLL